MHLYNYTRTVTELGLGLLLLTAVIAIGLSGGVAMVGEGFVSTPPHSTTPPDHITTALAKLPKPTKKQLDHIQSLKDTQAKQLSFLRKGMRMGKQLTKTHVHTRETKDDITAHYLRLHPMPTDKRTVVTLLWSGGLASTFRLCVLLFVKKRTVRPVFLASDTSLDGRHSAQQERETVRRLVTYLHKHHTDVVRHRLLQVQTIRCDKDKVGGMHTSRNDTTNQQVVRQWMTALERKTSHAITPFYIALARMPERQEVFDTFLRKGPIEMVLSEHTPYRILLAAVKKHGALATKASPKVPYGCVYTVSAAPSTAATESIASIARTALAQCVGHIRFVCVCELSAPTATSVSNYARQHGFADVLNRTWSCLNPQHTASQRQTIRNSRIVLPTPRQYRPPPRASPTSEVHRQWVQETSAMAASKPDPLIIESPFPKPVAWVPCGQCISCMHRGAEHVM